MSKRTSKKTPEKEEPKIKLDLSYGELPPNHPFIRPAGFNPRVYPWNLKAGSVGEASSMYLLQRLPGPERCRFMDELWRVLVDGGKAAFVVPYWSSNRSVQDPFAEWPPLCETSFLYFNRKFREDNKLADYKMASDFDFVYGFGLEAETIVKADDVRSHWIKHFTNTVNDVHVSLTKRGADAPVG